VKTVGRVIASHLPSTAVACRYGGDEFVIALPYCAEADGFAFADSLRRAVHATVPVLAGLSFPATTLSVSIGVACRALDSREARRDDTEYGEALFQAADRALYQAKRTGRNHVCVAQPAGLQTVQT
jgi:diguanylate cyclase (GGDEF)-like protein